MSRILLNINNVDAADADYLAGRIRNKSVSPAVVGTPVVEELYGDLIQAFQKMLIVAGITVNDLPDNETNGYQLLEALKKFMGGIKTTISTSGGGDILATGLVGVTNINITYQKITSPTSGEYTYDLDPGCCELYAVLTPVSDDGKDCTITVEQEGSEIITLTSTSTTTKHFYIKKVGGEWIELQNSTGAPIVNPKKVTTPIS